MAVSSEDPRRREAAGGGLMAEDEPDLVYRISHAARNTLYAAGFGVAFGASIAAMRRQNVGFYAVSMGMNYMVFGGTFFAFREGLTAYHGEHGKFNSAVSGSMAGGLLTTLFTGSVLRGAQGALVWGGAAYCAQSAYDIVAGRTEAYRRFVLKEKALREEDAQLQAKHGPNLVPRGSEAQVAAGPSGQAGSASSAVSPAAVLAPFRSSQDSFHDMTPDEAAAARVAWLQANKANLEAYGVSPPVVHASPSAVSGYTPGTRREGGSGADDLSEVPTRAELRRQSPLTNPAAAGAPAHARIIEQEQRAAQRRARAAMAEATGVEVSEEEVLAALEPGALGAFDPSSGAAHPFQPQPVDSYDDGWWEWLPIKMHTDEQMEQRLMKRLRQIERALMRDDEYRRIEVGAMRAATEPDELRALRNSPQLYYPEAMRIPPPAPVNREAQSADR